MTLAVGGTLKQIFDIILEFQSKLRLTYMFMNRLAEDSHEISSLIKAFLKKHQDLKMSSASNLTLVAL